jgi:hypothetical protein
MWVLWVPRPLSAAIKLTWILTIAGPVFVIAALLLANGLKHRELHAKRPWPQAHPKVGLRAGLVAIIVVKSPLHQ